MAGEQENKISIRPELASNPNYIKFKDMEAELKQKYLGQWVAFVDGELVVIEADKEKFFEKVTTLYPADTPAVYVWQILEEEKVYERRSLVHKVRKRTRY